MSFREFLTSNYVFLFEVIGFWLLLFISVYSSKKLKILTRLAILLMLFESVVYVLEKYFQTFEGFNIWRVLTTSAVYSLYPIILIIIMQITSPLEKKYYWVYLPALVVIPVYFTSQWTHFVFYFGDENNYHGGIISWLPYYIFGLYFVILVIRTTFYFRKYPLMDRVCLYSLFLMSAFGVILYLIFDVDKDYNLIFLTALLLYYLYLYIHDSKTDNLTSLLNRQSYYKDMYRLNNRLSAVASVDMNDLKWFNDNMGHEEGDKALKTIADVLTYNVSERKRVYRVGGDEFMILYSFYSEEKVVKDIETMRQKLSETPYICAFGYEIHMPGGDIAGTIRRSDERMYENKAEIKREILEKGGTIHKRDDD